MEKYSSETMKQIRNALVVAATRKGGNIELAKAAEDRLKKVAKKKGN